MFAELSNQSSLLTMFTRATQTQANTRVNYHNHASASNGTYHKEILHSRGKPSVISYNGVTVTSSADKAELFNLYFSSVFRPQSTTNVNTSYLNIHDQSFTWPLMFELTISVNEVAKCPMDLDITKSCMWSRWDSSQTS